MVSVRFEREKDHWVLWQDKEVRVVIQQKANFPAVYGGHLVVEQKKGASTPYSDYALFAKMSVIAAAVQKGLEQTGLAPHANIQSNANWAFRETDGSFRDVEEGRKRRELHIHVYGRTTKDPGWGEPIRPAHWHEQKGQKYWGQKYWGQVWPEEKMTKLANFLEKEIPTALEKP